MKITVEATGATQTVNGTPARLWKGKTESGIEILCWIAMIEVSADTDRTEFDRELREVKVERQLVSFDMRMID